MQKMICLLFTLLLFMSLSYGQDKIFKEVKSLEKEINFSLGEKLVINGQRTFLTLRSWNKPIIQAKVEVISRHMDQAQAKKDLEFIFVIFDKKGKTHTYSNAIQLKQGESKPLSSLKINLELYVPEYALVEIENHFGHIDIQGAYKNLKSNSTFTPLNIVGFSGLGRWTSHYGDAHLEDCQGSIKIVADRSNLTLKKINADVNIGISYGELEYYYDSSNFAPNVLARYSPVRLYLSEELSHPIDFECQQCDIASNKDPLIVNKSETAELLSGSIGPQGSTPKGLIYSEMEDITIHFNK